MPSNTTTPDEAKLPPVIIPSREERAAAREANHIRFLVSQNNTPETAEKKWKKLRALRGFATDGEALAGFQAAYGKAYAEAHAAEPVGEPEPVLESVEPVAEPSDSDDDLDLG